MEIELVIPLEELNCSYLNRTLTCSGNITELSSIFKEDDYGFIQIAFLQNPKNYNQRIGIQQDVGVILQEMYIGKVSLGDKVQIKGDLIIYNAHNIKSKYFILPKNLKIINNERNIIFTEREIEGFENTAKQPLVQQKLAHMIFDDLLVEDDIKLIGTLILFCIESPKLRGIHSNISFLIIGTSGTYKTPFLRILKNIRPNQNYKFSQKSDFLFISKKSRYKIKGQYCNRAGLSDLAKNGMILIDNLEELKSDELSKLDKNFSRILAKSSILAAVHTKECQYNDKKSIYENLKFPRKNNLLKKFDIVLIAANNPYKNMINFEEKRLTKTEKKNNKFLVFKNRLTNYMRYAKKFDPMFSDKTIIDQIVKFKEEVIKLNIKKNQVGTINSHGVVRVLTMLSKAYARIALKNEINGNDVQKIISIYKKSLENLDLI